MPEAVQAGALMGADRDHVRLLVLRDLHEMIGDGVAGGEADFDALAQLVDPFAAAIVAGFSSVAGLALGDWDRLERVAEPVLGLDPAANFTFWGAGLQMGQAVARLNLGRHDETTIADFETAMTRYAGSGVNTERPSYLANFAIGLTAVGAASTNESSPATKPTVTH